MKKQDRFHLLRGEHGASLVELALVLPVFSLLLVGAIDFGRALYISTELTGAAHAAAVYGSQNPTDTAGMNTAAQDAAPDVPSLSVTTPTYGCECSDGTSYSASCGTTPSCSSNNVVYLVKVTVSGTYHPLLSWPGVFHTSMSLSSSASMRSAGS
ncbi:MAG: TadE/TadG family type IV pilus assembly protein [Acidobacteriaceae bacterium]|jgi:Flp pilus assembly protein TadG